MIMNPVSSSHIKAIGYDETTQTMKVEYNQASYEYSNVPKVVYEQIMSADSKGRALKEAVTVNNFSYKRV
jgi:hypothetical protein